MNVVLVEATLVKVASELLPKFQTEDMPDGPEDVVDLFSKLTSNGAKPVILSGLQVEPMTKYKLGLRLM